jgi:hypothetical protein
MRSNFRVLLPLLAAALCLCSGVHGRWVVHFKPENKEAVLAELTAAGYKVPTVGSFFAAVELGSGSMSQGAMPPPPPPPR